MLKDEARIQLSLLFVQFAMDGGREGRGGVLYDIPLDYVYVTQGKKKIINVSIDSWSLNRHDWISQGAKSQLEFRPLLLHPSIPLPFLPTSSLYSLIHPSQFHGEPRAQFLQTSSDSFHTLHLLPIWPHHILLRRSLLPKDIPVPPKEYIIALIMQRHHLPSLQVRLRREHCTEEMCGEQAKGCAKVIEDEFWGVVCGITVSRQSSAFNPIADGEVECGAGGEVHDREAGGFLLVFFQYDDGGVLPICGERGDLADGKFVTVAMGGAGDVYTMREEVGEEIAFVMEGRI